jgi:hypothetical protein
VRTNINISRDTLTLILLLQLLSPPMNVCHFWLCHIVVLRLTYCRLRPLPIEGSGKTRESPSVFRMCFPLLDLSRTYRPFSLRCHQIVIESYVALFLGITGACLKAPPLKEITWASEMRTRCVTPHLCSLLTLCGWQLIVFRLSPLHSIYAYRTIDDMDARMGFANFVTRGKVLGKEEAPSS